MSMCFDEQNDDNDDVHAPLTAPAFWAIAIIHDRQTGDIRWCLQRDKLFHSRHMQMSSNFFLNHQNMCD